jgi:hypothetical protein
VQLANEAINPVALLGVEGQGVDVNIRHSHFVLRQSTSFILNYQQNKIK